MWIASSPRKNRISLPLIHLYKSSSLVEREIVLNDLRILAGKDRTIKKVALDRILQNLKTKGSLDYCRKKINEYIDQSIMDIQSLKDTTFKFCLIQMAKLLRRHRDRNSSLLCEKSAKKLSILS